VPEIKPWYMHESPIILITRTYLTLADDIKT
jgi:hypothetical protein